MRILMVVSEATPFAKTGGLGDVLGSLPAALAARGQQVAENESVHAGFVGMIGRHQVGTLGSFQLLL